LGDSVTSIVETEPIGKYAVNGPLLDIWSTVNVPISSGEAG